jgi:hypothetical protein
MCGACLASELLLVAVDEQQRRAAMPKTRGEDDKKHGDKLESLIERTGGNPSARESEESADDDASDPLADDEEDALLQDDEDEDFEDDDVESDRDVDERE